MTYFDLRKLPKQQFPILADLSKSTNGSPLSVTISAINKLKDPTEIASFANELVLAYATLLPIDKSSRNAGALISYALGGFNHSELDALWGGALPQINAEAGWLPTPNEEGVIAYHDRDGLGNSLREFMGRNRLK